MASFLELVKDVERESGTISQTLTTVVNQSGRHGMFVQWVRDAWDMIQSSRTSWDWQRADWQMTLFAAVNSYTPADIGLEPRFKAWVFDTETGHDISIYDPDQGQATEGFLSPAPWIGFRRVYRTGSNAASSSIPTIVSLGPRDALHVWPTPDKGYVLRGEYFKGKQTLELDADIPECPREYQDAIKYQALLLMADYDESWNQAQTWSSKLASLIKQLEATQLPRIRMGGPLA